MKKNLTRILAVLLIAMMLVPTLATFAVSAEETETAPVLTPENNIFKLAGVDVLPSDKTMGQTTEKEGQMASQPVATTRNNYLYIGPCPEPEKASMNTPLVYWYKSSGAYTNVKTLYSLQGDESTGGNVVDRFPNGYVIVKVKVNNQNYKNAAVGAPSTYADYMVMTDNVPFTVADYYKYADSQGWDIESVGLRIPPPAVSEEKPEGHEGLWNLFQTKAKPDTSATQNSAANVYVQSNFIKVVPGDTITMGAISTKETQTVLYEYDADFKEIRKYKKGDSGIDFVKDIGNDYAIYSHTIPARPVDKDGNLINPDAKEVAYVKVAVHSGIYNDGNVLVTKNQPFDPEAFREALEIAEPSAEVKAHAFYGKKALFVGDSISYGDYDTPPSYTNPSASFARRLALATGLVPTNVSHPTATVGKTGKPNIKYEWDLLKTALMGKKNYDMVVFQGGINDARQNIAVGEMLPVTTGRDVLVENARVATFVGGLQLMFYDAITQWPEAEFYYIANYKVDAAATNNKDMGEYYAQAKALCAAYGVHYIDLYNDTEINQILTLTENVENGLYADDNFTPVKSTYDLIAPAVIRLFNASLSENLVKPDLSGDDNSTETPTTPNTEPEEEPEGLSIGLIIGIAAAGVVVLAGGGFALYWFVIRKKKTVATKTTIDETKTEE